MTTFQDPPPQSRRAVRQSERGDASAEGASQSLPYSFDQGAQDAASAEQHTASSDAPQVSGRRAQLPQAAVVPQRFDNVQGFEPLTYVTQGRPIPSGSSIEAAGSIATTGSIETGSVETDDGERQAPPATDHFSRQPLSEQDPPSREQPAFRVRDFSPEGRRAAISREQFSGVSQTPAPPTPPSVDLDYFTVGAPAAHAHVATPPHSDEPAANHTLTRRELRELRAAQEEPPALRLPEPIDALLNSGPIDIPVLSAVPGQSQALADAMAEFDALTRGRREAGARAASEAATPAIHSATPQSRASQVEAEAPVAPAPQIQAAPAPASVPVVSASIPLPVTSTPWPAPSSAPVPLPEVSAVAPAPEPAAPQPQQEVRPAVDPVFIEPERAPSTRPVGHWSVQAQIDDDEQSGESTISRTVGSGSVAVTTSALVLPSVPQSSDFTSPFSATGEILVTGSIDLPRSLSSTGAHPHRVDNSDFEDDPLDSEVPSTDSAPVRAIRAVSTHTSTRGVIESKRPQSNRMPTIMIIAASVLAVGVVGLLVAAAVMHLFG